MDLQIKGIFSANGVHFGRTTKADFSRVRFDKSAFFQESQFEGEAEFRAIHIGGEAAFHGAVFTQKVSFNSARIDQHALFPAAIFEGEANFSGLHVGGVADFGAMRISPEAVVPGAVFKEKVTFNSAKIEHHAFFRKQPQLNTPAAIFEGEADFGRIQIGGQADFQGAVFQKNASFAAAKIDQDALFRATTFEGEAVFAGIHIGGQAGFEGAVFKNEEKKANFNSAKIDQHAFFRGRLEQNLPAAIFEGEADFAAMHVGGAADFRGAVFKKKASFDSAKIDQHALLPTAGFKGEADFRAMHIGGKADFQGAVFEQNVRFNSVQVHRGASFEDVIVHEEANFDGGHFAALANFGSTKFLNAVTFCETSFRTVRFSADKEQFKKSIDLRGCTYERIQANWESLLERLNPDPYDRQPYIQLERALRTIGDDRMADEVYLRRQRAERKWKWKHDFWAWVFNWIYNLLVSLWCTPRPSDFAVIRVADPRDDIVLPAGSKRLGQSRLSPFSYPLGMPLV